MSNRSVSTYPRLRSLCPSPRERIRAARLRRRISVAEMAERMDVLGRLYTGSSEATSRSDSASWSEPIGVIGLDGDLAALAADDELGHRLADASSTPKRRA